MPLFKTLGIPILKKGGEAVTNELLKSATNIASDVFKGKNVRTSAKDNLSDSLTNLSNSVHNNLSKLSKEQNGKGYKRFKLTQFKNIN